MTNAGRVPDPPSASRHSASEASPSPTTILVVEDEFIVARDLQARLVTLGFHVPVTVGTGERAVEEAGKRPPDLVIMDIGLAGSIDGVEAARRIRELHDIPVIIATAYSDEPTIQRARAIRPAGFILKPYEARDLRLAIEMALYKHTSERELKASEERYRQVFEASPVGVFHCTADGTLTDANQRLAVILRTSRESLVDHTYTAAFDGAILPAMRRSFAGEASVYEGVYTTPAGEVWISLRVAPVMEPSGKVRSVIGIVEDITERKRVEDALVRRVSFEELVAHIATRLITLDHREFDTDVEQTLSMIGQFLGADRCFVDLVGGAERRVEHVYEWCAAGIRSARAHHLGVALATFPWTSRRLDEGEPVCVHRVSDFPSDAERTFWETEHTRSLMLFPLTARQQLLGTFGVVTEQREQLWVGEDRRLLGLVSEILAAVFVQIRPPKAALDGEYLALPPELAATQYTYLVRLEDGHWQETVHGPGCLEVTGYSPEEYRNDPYLWLRMVDERDRLAVMDHVQKVLAGEPVPPIEHRIVRKDGTVRWLKNTPVQRFDALGRLVAYDGVVQDITERREAEEALKRSEEQYRMLVESINDVVFVLDGKGYFSFVTRKVESLTGFRTDEVIGQHFTRFVHPHDREPMMSVWEGILAGRVSRYEFRILTKGGEERYVRTSSSVREEEGADGSVVGIMSDMTERRRSELVLRESERRYREMLEALRSSALMLDLNGSILFCNSCFLEITGHRSEDVLGRRWQDLFLPPERRETFQRKYLDPLRAGNVPAGLPAHVATRDGVLVAMSWTTRALFSSEGDLVGITCIGRLQSETAAAGDLRS